MITVKLEGYYRGDLILTALCKDNVEAAKIVVAEKEKGRKSKYYTWIYYPVQVLT